MDLGMKGYQSLAQQSKGSNSILTIAQISPLPASLDDNLSRVTPLQHLCDPY